MICFENVTKKYPVESAGGAGLKERLLHPAALRLRSGQAGGAASCVALQDVSFEVRPGECFGVIGRNGSGKSTTLGLAAGVLRPTAGAVNVRGRVAPLLELGAGFHPELSGEENLVLNAVLLGLTRREAAARRDAIVAFAELEEVIRRPLRTYSAGMVARLGFAVVAHLDPDVLLIDEVLAVGDAPFQARCERRMKEFRAKGVTMMFVSHDLAAVERICDRAVLLDNGRIAAAGAPAEVIVEYRRRTGGTP